jgi:hypothetical protein
VTKLVATWKADGAQPIANSVVVRYNIGKYGLHELDYDWYIYNNADCILKAVTFWIIRKSQTWKHVKFSTALHMLNVEAFDGVTINFANAYVANQSVLSMVQQATYNSLSNTIDFDIWTPVVAGTMTPHPFSYPADVDPALVYPINLVEEAGQDPPARIRNLCNGAAPSAWERTRPVQRPVQRFQRSVLQRSSPILFARAGEALGCQRQEPGQSNPGNVSRAKSERTTPADTSHHPDCANRHRPRQ